eukprot:917095_1
MAPLLRDSHRGIIKTKKEKNVNSLVEDGTVFNPLMRDEHYTQNIIWALEIKHKLVQRTTFRDTPKKEWMDVVFVPRNKRNEKVQCIRHEYRKLEEEVIKYCEELDVYCVGDTWQSNTMLLT